MLSFRLLVLLILSTQGLFSTCPFCDSEVLGRQQYYEDDLVIALFTHRPTLTGHSLVIPKRHVERFEELNDAEILRIGQVIKKVNSATMEVFGTSAYLLLQKNGQEVGQTVPHVHFHYIPRKAGDDSTVSFLFNMYWSKLGSPMPQAEMDELVNKMTLIMNKECNG